MHSNVTELSFFPKQLNSLSYQICIKGGGKTRGADKARIKMLIILLANQSEMEKKKLARFNGTVDNKQGMMNVEQHLLPLIPINPKPPLFICKLSRILLLFK